MSMATPEALKTKWAVIPTHPGSRPKQVTDSSKTCIFWMSDQVRHDGRELNEGFLFFEISAGQDMRVRFFFTV
jgi:hypothetical protein